MLKELFIKNFAVIEQADIDFSDGLNIFTGETGAGKSVVIGSLSAVCGNRVSRDIIRTGAEKATVTAVFSEKGEEIILSREITADGKSTARINGEPKTAAELAKVAADLLNIHGQRDTAALFSPEFQLSLADSFGALGDDIDSYRDTFTKLRETAKKLKESAEKYRENAVKLEAAKTAVLEIEALKIKPDEDTENERELRFLENAESFCTALSGAKELLRFSDDGGGALNLVRLAADNIKPFTETSEETKELAARLDSLYIELSDITRELGKNADSAVYSEEKLKKLSERKAALGAVKKRYGGSLEAVFETLADSKKLIAQSGGLGNEIAVLSEKKQELLSKATEKAEALSKKRQAAAERLCAEIKDKLAFLDIPQCEIRFDFSQGKLTQNGFDTAEIMISPNPGEEMKPLAKIASGGELSRIMLAVKAVTAKYADVGTMIFDEIDAGVSGRAAEKIGRVLRELSKARQIIVVTHLAQIAVCADRHLLIEKTAADRTYTHIKPLDENDRALEIARIQVGANITETAVKNAREQIALLKSL
ncbi:MAG: DNA repair protein RecN [Ruminococcus sp.]|jgi:DNA repair protein RecN (Recombination protein N)|nr:DNA repair protein RecN [Ruminococcus sp.]